MHTTGQPYMMAFQAGGPHAQDRGLEALAYAYKQLSVIPSESVFEKPTVITSYSIHYTKLYEALPAVTVPPSFLKVIAYNRRHRGGNLGNL